MFLFATHSPLHYLKINFIPPLKFPGWKFSTETQMLVRNHGTAGCKAPASTPYHFLWAAARAEAALCGSSAGPTEGTGQPIPGQNAALGIAISQSHKLWPATRVVFICFFAVELQNVDYSYTDEFRN